MSDENKIKLIYILGVSYSGSTILGYFLSYHFDIYSLGELKFYNRIHAYKNLKCSCGAEIHACTFWKKFWFKYRKVYENPGIIRKVFIVLKIILGIGFFKEKYNTDDAALLSDIHSYIKKERCNENDFYLLDASKSLWRLNHLLGLKELEVSVIYLKRGIDGNVNSFKKHGFGFLYGLLTYKLNNFLISIFLRSNRDKIPWIKIEHERFCKNQESVIAEVENFFGLRRKISPNSGFAHIPSGNLAVLHGKGGNIPLKHDNCHEAALNGFEKKILRVLK